ncbi:MAG: hemerythrin domain-containing protein [Solirubrobacterales bacterium]
MLTNSQIGALLHDDHMNTIAMLQNLEELVGSHRSAPKVDEDLRATLATTERTIRDEVEKHFGFEEGYLFTEFTRLGETGIVTMLTHEHRSILPLALSVADLAAKAVADGAFDDGSWTEFCDAASELVEREIFHIQKEEMGLLGAISALLDDETDQRLAETYRRVVG